VTSIQKELGIVVEMAEIKQIFTSHFLHTFGLEKISKSKIFE
jgi:hypothetical protein